MSMTNMDQRKYADPYPVARWQQDYPIVATGSEASGAISNVNGMAKKIYFKIPDVELSGSGNAILKDMDGNILYETGSQADNATFVGTGDYIPLCSDMSVFINTTGSPAAGDGSVWLTIYYV